MANNVIILSTWVQLPEQTMRKALPVEVEFCPPKCTKKWVLHNMAGLTKGMLACTLDEKYFYRTPHSIWHKIPKPLFITSTHSPPNQPIYNMGNQEGITTLTEGFSVTFINHKN